MICVNGQSLATAHTAGRRFGGMSGGGGVQAERLLASSISARAPWRRSRCSWRRRLAAPPPWLALSSSLASSSSSDWRNSMGSCCSWSSALALLWGFALVVVGARCSRVCQYLFGSVSDTALAGHVKASSWRRDGFCSLLCQPLCHSLVVHRLGFALALLWFFSLQAGEGVLGTVTVGVCEPISASCEQKHQRSEKWNYHGHLGNYDQVKVLDNNAI